MKTLSHRFPRLRLAAACAAFPSAASAFGHDAADAANPAAGLGQVHFKVDCNAAAQKEFDRHHARVVELTDGNDGSRAEVARARRFMASR